jgi:hypothetical protein
MSKYADWVDSLLEQGIYLSEFKRLAKEKFPDLKINLYAFIHRRKKQGWKIESRKEGSDTFYKVIEKPQKRVGVEEVVKEVIEKDMINTSQSLSNDASNDISSNVSSGEEKINVSIDEEKVDISGSEEKVLCGAGVYVLQYIDGKYKLTVKVGTESKTVEFEQGDPVDVIRSLFDADVEVKKMEKDGEVEKGVFALYKVK